MGKPRAWCRGSGRPARPETPGQCSACYRETRFTLDGNAFKHYAKAPVAATDPKHDKYVQEKYGITGAEYEAILAAQGGVCAICRKPPASKRLAVDHDHKLGFTREAVRGLLCRRCNHRLLGSANDEIENLQRAIDYLTGPPARKVLGTNG